MAQPIIVKRFQPRVRMLKEHEALLLRAVLGRGIDSYEKPTAQAYYENIVEENPTLLLYSWKALRDKMRYLKTTYARAIEWLRESGSGLDEDAIHARISKICDSFDQLHAFFSKKMIVNSQSDAKNDAESGSIDSACNGSSQRGLSISIRTDGRKRWIRQDETVLLLSVSERGIEEYEKPTAQVYYRNVIDENPQLETYTWKGLRDKMRYLKMSYIRAIQWRTDSGSGLNENTIRTNIYKICENFDLLDEIFSERVNINVNPIASSQLDVQQDEDLYMEYAGEQDEDTQEFIPVKTEIIEKESSDIVTSSASGITFSTNSLTMREIQIERNNILRETLRATMDVEVRKLNFEREKLRAKEADSERWFQLKKLKMEKDLELRKYELELKYKSVPPTTNST